MIKRILSFFVLPLAVAQAEIDEIGGIAVSTLDLAGYSHIGGQALPSGGGTPVFVASSSGIGTSGTSVTTGSVSSGAGSNKVAVVSVSIEDTDGTLVDVSDVSWNGSSFAEIANQNYANLNRHVFYYLAIGNTNASSVVTVTLSDGTYNRGAVVNVAIFENCSQVTPSSLTELQEFPAFPRTVSESYGSSGIVVAGWSNADLGTFSAGTDTELASEESDGTASCSGGLFYRIAASGSNDLTATHTDTSGTRCNYASIFLEGI